MGRFAWVAQPTCVTYGVLLFAQSEASVVFSWVMFVVLILSGWVNQMLTWRSMQVALLLQAALAMYVTLTRDALVKDV